MIIICDRIRNNTCTCKHIFLHREKEGSCLAKMSAKPAICDKTSGGRFIQSFSKSNFADSSSTTTTLSKITSTTTAVDTLLTMHDRVVISSQDGSSWAIAIGTILSLTCSAGGSGVEVCVLADKAVPTDLGVLYRIDMAPGFSRGLVPSTLADWIASDSERYSSLP